MDGYILSSFGSRFSAQRTLISASAVPHCSMKIRAYIAECSLLRDVNIDTVDAFALKLECGHKHAVLFA